MLDFLLLPPLAFIILLSIGLLLSYGIGLKFPQKMTGSGRKYESYACGQRNVTHNVSLDYDQFFSIAFFFTVMHAMILVIATAPKDAITLPLIYVAAGALALLIIFRR